MTSSSDENGNASSTTYTKDPYFWRPDNTTDQLANVTSFTYAGATKVEAVLPVVSGQSAVGSFTTADSLGRPYVDQERTAPGSSNFDTVTRFYDSVGRPYRISVPCVKTAGQPCSATPGTTATYDGAGRPIQITDGGGGTVSYSYSGNDVLQMIGPPPSGENVKAMQLEYDGLGRLTSVCEITTASGSATCGQSNSQTGFWTRYQYDASGNLTGVCQNTTVPMGTNCVTSPSAGQQTRIFAYDGLGRLTSETNPETSNNGKNGTVTYTYDSISPCGDGTNYSFPGDLVQKKDNAQATTCFAYDALHRLTNAGNGTLSNPTCRRFIYDSATVNGVTMSNTAGRLAEARTDSCTPSPNPPIKTDEGFSYDANGRMTDAWESTPNSAGYYHVSEKYWPNGGLETLSMSPLPTITYGALDGEGRPTSVTASSGQNPVSSVSYDTTGGSGRVLGVTYGSGDSDAFNYDSNTGRMLQYTFNMNGQAEIGALTWNANGTLQQLQITDPFNSADNQTCTYGTSTAAGYDDLGRLINVNCGTAWSQTFSYDAFGNISKSGSITWACPACYNEATNQYNSTLSAQIQYDANGNLLNDTAHTYTWDANWERPLTIDSISLTFDAFGRQVEQYQSGTYYQFVYEPSGKKLAKMLGQTVQQAFVPLPGGGTAEYVSWGLSHYRHTDWLGSDHLASSYKQSSTPVTSNAYAPFGEPYAQTGNGEISFTGQNKDTVWLQYDFLARQYAPHQGRWISPDPKGLGAADPTSPQSWNRYAYVLNNPLSNIDSAGLTCVTVTGGDLDSETFQGSVTITKGDCDPTANNQFYFDGTVSQAAVDANGNVVASVDGKFQCSGDSGCSIYDNMTSITVNGDSPGQVGIVPLTLSQGQLNTVNSGGAHVAPATTDLKQQYCSHQADMAALESILPYGHLLL